MPFRDPDLRVEELLTAPTPPPADDLAAALQAQHPIPDRRWQVLGAVALACGIAVFWRGCATAATPMPMHSAVVTQPSSRPTTQAFTTDDGSGPPASRSYTARPAATAPTSAKPAEPTSSKLNINAATAADFDQLPGIGPVLAQRIVAWRRAHGRFSDLHELLEVKGIGPAKFAKLSPLVRAGR